MSFDAAKFEASVGSLGLKHFNHKELLTRTNYAKNSPPPAKLWHNIAPTILVLDALREEVGKPIKLISVYRTEAYNDYKNHDGRAPLSQHQAFTAIDFSVSGTTAAEARCAAAPVRHASRAPARAGRCRPRPPPLPPPPCGPARAGRRWWRGW